MTWQPMRRTTQALSEQVRELAKTNQALADTIEMSKEMWGNDRYTVIVHRNDSGEVTVLSIRKNNRGPVMDWRHMQRIKTEIAGADVEAFQIFPAEDRLVDTANQTWLWCLPPGVRIPAGFDNRNIGGPEEAAKVHAKQRPFEEGILS